MLDVELTSHHGRMATRSGQNVTKAEKHVVNVSKTKRDGAVDTAKSGSESESPSFSVVDRVA